MKSYAGLVASLMAFVLLSPIAAATTGGTVALLFKSPSELVVEMRAQQDGEDASDFRSQMDQNNDGQVTATEVEAAEEMLRSIMSSSEDQSSEALLMDGKGSTSMNLTHIDIRDAEGRTDSTQAVHIDLDLRLTFPAAGGDRHLFRTNGSDDTFTGGSLAESVTARLVAPPGYTIGATENLPAGATVSGDKKELNLGSSLKPATGEMSITFVKGGGKSPAAGPLVVSLALIAAVLGRRRQPSA